MRIAVASLMLLSCLMTDRVPAATPVTHYVLDPSHSTLRFTFVQAGARNTGDFKNFTTVLDFSPEALASSHLDVTVDIKSLDTGDEERNDTLRGTDLFDVSHFPQARFVATQFVRNGDGYEAQGKLTIRGVTRDARVPFTFRSESAQGKALGYMSGKTTIKRLDFAVGQGDWKSTEWIANEVIVEYALRLTAAVR